MKVLLRNPTNSILIKEMSQKSKYKCWEEQAEAKMSFSSGKKAKVAKKVLETNPSQARR